jgi:hypothetical protein
MEKQTDDQVAVSMVEKSQAAFPLRAVSFDKGFHSPANRQALEERLELVALPKKGRHSSRRSRTGNAPEFVQGSAQAFRGGIGDQRPGNFGLDLCPDHGIVGFKRYVALAVLARNIHRLGVVVRERNARTKSSCLNPKPAPPDSIVKSDYPRFAEPLRDRIREAAQALATAQGARIEHVAKAHIRKEDLVAAVLKDRGDHPGLVHVLSAMEACDAYEPWHDKPSHQTFLRHTSGKCLHYYFYWMDETLGLIYLRVPTWSPFRLQFYCNGHSRLAHSLTTAGIDYAMADNAFIRITDWERAQQLADAFSPDTLHALLDHYAEQCCPILDVFGQSYHWSLMQVEYSTDLVFRSDAILKSLYEELSRQAIFSVKAEQVASFLGKKITPQLAQELGSRFTTRIEGTCIKHHFGKVSASR